MSDDSDIGVWQPGSAVKAIDRALLETLVAAGEGVAEVTAGHLARHGLEAHQWLMRCEADAWAPAAALSSPQLLALVRFFTLVEGSVSGWEAGSRSPVIPLVKLLRARGDFTAETRQWIKAHTRNRYLPHGSAL